MDEDGGEEDALQQAAWAVYGVPPADFVATRTRWVKELRSRRQRGAATSVAALRKPSVSAAAINSLVRAQDPAVDRLRDVGTRMRHAQSALDAEGLAGLRGERDAALHDWVEAARTHATGPLTAAVEAEVRDTAVAALADSAAAEVVLSGTLTRGLSYSGFGEVDVSDAVARTSTGVVLTRLEGGGGDDPTDAEEIDDQAVDLDGEGDSDADDDLDEDDLVEEEADDPDEDGPGEEGDEEDSGEQGEEEEDRDKEREDEGDEVVAASSGEDGLTQLEEALAEAEEQVTAARRERRTLLEAAKAAAARVEEAEDGLAQAKKVLARAEKESERAEAVDGQARAALEGADEALAAARERRAQARIALEEAEDAD